MHVAFNKRCVPSPTNSPFKCSKNAKRREPPVLETGLFNPSSLDLSVTVTFGLQLFVFVHDFLLERSFSIGFILAIGSSLSFFFSFCRACMCQPGRQKSDTARCHWRREVNVIRRPLPRTTGRTSESLHASS